jgi:hypothetical protein
LKTRGAVLSLRDKPIDSIIVAIQFKCRLLGGSRIDPANEWSAISGVVDAAVLILSRPVTTSLT